MYIRRPYTISSGDLAESISKFKGIPYNAACSILHDVNDQDSFTIDASDDFDQDWCKEVVEYMVANGIEELEVHRD